MGSPGLFGGLIIYQGHLFALKENLLWMDKILHHLKTLGLCFPCIYPQTMVAMVSKWCRSSATHSMAASCAFLSKLDQDSRFWVCLGEFAATKLGQTNQFRPPQVLGKTI